jgi:anti-sigma regulatory factor (Ser/Thr protein kinase)
MSRFSLKIPERSPAGGPLILANLAGNAVKFTEQGEVSVSADEGDGILRIAIKDTGIGMAHEETGRSFKLFRQIEGRPFPAEMPILRGEGT